MDAPGDPTSVADDAHSPTSLGKETTPQSPCYSGASCSRPPSSLLVERPRSVVSVSRINVTGLTDREPILSSPISPAHGAFESTALQPSFKYPKSSWSSLATTFDKDSPKLQKIDEEEARGRPRAPKPTNFSKGHFDGPRPIGDPVLFNLPGYQLEFPPPSRDKYPDEDVLFQPKNSSKSIDVENLLEAYSEQGAELVDFLAAQGQARNKAYEPVNTTYKHTWDTLAEFWRIQREKSPETLAAEWPKPVGRLQRTKRLYSPPKLSPSQLKHMRKLEINLVGTMDDLAINHGETEGTIAGIFTTRWDDAQKQPPEHVPKLLMETGFDKRLFHKPIIPGPELREVQYGNELLQKPLSESFYQKQIDEVRPKHREAFNKAFRSYQPPDTATNIKPDTPIFSTSLTKVLIPEWFPILDNYNIIHLWSTTPTARFTELLNNIHDLQERCKQAAEQRRQQKWDKEWHEPKRGWSTPVRQENGG